MFDPADLQKPRSAWPKGTLKVNAWHRDEHLVPLLRESDSIAARYPEASAAGTLPPLAVAELAALAVHAECPYVATAAMDRLFDARESIDASVEALGSVLAGSPAKTRKRIAGCLLYLTAGGINRRPTTGRSFAQVRSDSDHFQALHERAKSLARMAQAPANERIRPLVDKA